MCDSSLNSRILDMELDTIFHDCPKDTSGKAQVQSLIDACVEKYGDGKPELRTILSMKMDPDGSNQPITKNNFKSKVRDWILGRDYGPEEWFSDTPPFTSTPQPSMLRRGLLRQTVHPYLSDIDDGSREVSPHRISRNDELRVLKSQNTSLESQLSRAEERARSLEDSLKKVRLEKTKQLENCKAELHRLSGIENLYSETREKANRFEDNLSKLSKDFDKLSGVRQTLEEERSRLEERNIFLQQELERKTSFFSDIELCRNQAERSLYQMDMEKRRLEEELCSSKTAVTELYKGQTELLNRIGELQNEKQQLQTQLSDALLSKNVPTFSTELDLPTDPRMMSAIQTVGERKPTSGISLQNEINASVATPSSYFSSFTESSSSCILNHIGRGTDSTISFDRLELIEKEVQTMESLLNNVGRDLLNKSAQTEPPPIGVSKDVMAVPESVLNIHISTQTVAPNLVLNDRISTQTDAPNLVLNERMSTQTDAPKPVVTEHISTQTEPNLIMTEFPANLSYERVPAAVGSESNQSISSRSSSGLELTEDSFNDDREIILNSSGSRQSDFVCDIVVSSPKRRVRSSPGGWSMPSRMEKVWETNVPLGPLAPRRLSLSFLLDSDNTNKEENSSSVRSDNYFFSGFLTNCSFAKRWRWWLRTLLLVTLVTGLVLLGTFGLLSNFHNFPPPSSWGSHCHPLLRPYLHLTYRGPPPI